MYNKVAVIIVLQFIRPYDVDNDECVAYACRYTVVMGTHVQCSVLQRWCVRLPYIILT